MKPPSFKTPQINPYGLTRVGAYATPSFADIDGDGDLDAFVGGPDGNTRFFKNTGTASSPTFAAASTNPFGLSAEGAFDSNPASGLPQLMPDPSGAQAQPYVLPTMGSGPREIRAADPALDGGKKEVAFIDTAVADYQTLVDGVRPGVEVVLIDSNQRGLAQMAQWAENHSGYDAVHVLSHGSAGTLHLGQDTLTESSLSDAGVQTELAQLGRALTPEGDLLVYGCDVASGEVGQQFVADLATAMGTDVAASVDATGNAEQGGDWEVEYVVGTQNTRPNLSLHGVPFSSKEMWRFDGVLASVTLSFTGSDADYSSPTATKNVADNILVNASNGFIE